LSTAKDVYERRSSRSRGRLFIRDRPLRVWWEADLYEYEAKYVRLNQPATLSLQYEPGVVPAQVDYVYPYLNTETRTLPRALRTSIIRPAAQAGHVRQVLLSGDETKAFSYRMPRHDTGTRQLVFVEVSAGRFEPRAVTVGRARTAGAACFRRSRPERGGRGRELSSSTPSQKASVGPWPARAGRTPRRAGAPSDRPHHRILRQEPDSRPARHRGALRLRVQSCDRFGWTALPDLSDYPGHRVFTWDRSPDIIEDQVTYPIVSSLLRRAEGQGHRASPISATSFVYVIFQDGTDLYWGGSRVTEYLSKIQARLPEGVRRSWARRYRCGVGYSSTRSVDKERNALAR